MSEPHPDNFDTEPTDDVLQYTPDVIPAVPVTVEGLVQSEEMPGKLGSMRHLILRAGARAERILPEDPRRKRLTIWALAVGGGCEGVCIANTELDCNDFRGAFMWPGTGLLRYDFAFTDSLWARPLIINGGTTGAIATFAPSTDDTILSIVTENWTH